MFPKAITLVTLGVADLDRSRAFYAALGWEAAQANEGVVFIQLAGQVLALFGIAELADDMKRPRSELGTGAAPSPATSPARPRSTPPSRSRSPPGRRP